MGRAATRLGLCVGLAIGGALAQSDPLVSKTLPRLLADANLVYAFADGGLKYSRIDLFSDPPEIRNGSLPFKTGIQGGLGISSSLLLFFNSEVSDSVTSAGIASLDREGRTVADTLFFYRPKGHNNGVNTDVEASALAVGGNTLVVGGGRAGFALVPLGGEGERPLGTDTVAFWSLPKGKDTAVNLIRCKPSKLCRVDTLEWVSANLGEPDSVASLAIDSAAADTAWLLIGTGSGLRRGLLGGKAFPKVSLPGVKDKAAIRIESILADSRRNILWVFCGSRYFFSDDHGRSFRVPPDIAGIASKPSGFTGFNPAPQAALSGDTTFVNFNMDRPGLVLFKRDSVLENEGGGELGDVLLDADDGLDIVRGQGRLTSLAVVRKGDAAILAAGTTGKGLFYRGLTGGPGPFSNVNSLRGLKGSLGQIITFPTLFSGTAPDGSPEYVNIGYRLKQDGRVTITVYNYAMEKVKTLVRKARRKGGVSRSENTGEDRWDGRDESGRFVSVGTYYILVESEEGEKGWGKAIAVRGRN